MVKMSSFIFYLKNSGLSRIFIVVAVSSAIIIPLLPYIINRSPFMGDSWIHIAIAKRIVGEGRYQFGEYNLQWPLVNLLIAYMRIICGLGAIQSSQIIPFMAGLSALPLYAILRRLGYRTVSCCLGIISFTFFPFYTTIIFTSAVMKETATLYPVMTLLMYILMVWGRGGGARITITFLLTLGIVLGHHFAGLLALGILTALVLMEVYKVLHEPSAKANWGIIMLFAVYTLLFSLWNIYNIFLIGLFFPIALYDLLYSASFLMIISTSLLKGRGRCIYLAIIFSLLILYIGFRGLIYETGTPNPPITFNELINLSIIILIYSIGTYMAIEDGWTRAVFIGLLAAFLSASLWNIDIRGFIIFTKAAHYIPIILSLSIAKISESITRKLVIFPPLITIFLIFLSSYGLNIAMGGLSAYKIDEVVSTMCLLELAGENIILNTDTRGSYLIKHFFDRKTSIISPFSGGIIILYRTNIISGILYGYSWVEIDKILPADRIMSTSRLYDSQAVIALSP